ncbi:putative membrane protein [Rhodococcus wratislaviensis IFP 2016]|nr:putative membrane protein [Rhodococcus wratislaviensis IFP 2016]
MGRQLTRIVTALAVVLAIVLGAATTADAQDTEPQPGEDRSVVCQGVEVAGQGLGQLIPGFGGVNVPGLPSTGDVVGNLSGSLCDNNGNPVNAVKDFASEQLQEQWDSQFGKIVTSIIDGMSQAMIMAITWWIKIPNADLESFGPLAQINEYTLWIQSFLLIISIGFMSLRLAAARRQLMVEQAEETFRTLFRVVVTAATMSVIVALATRAGDAFAVEVVGATSNNDPAGTVQSMMILGAYSGMAPGLMLIIGFFGAFGALAQAFLMPIRQGFLIVAVAALPVAAAASGTKTGSQSYDKLLAWVIGFCLFKPVASLAYAMAFLTTQSSALDVPEGQTPTLQQFQYSLIGIALLASTALVLPALMRIITPAISAVGSGGSGAKATAGALLAGAALLTGGKALGGKLAGGKAVPPGGGFSGGGGGSGTPGLVGGGGNPGNGSGSRGNNSGSRGTPSTPGPRQGGPRGNGANTGSGPKKGSGAKASKWVGAGGGRGSRSVDSAAGDLAGDNYAHPTSRHNIPR